MFQMLENLTSRLHRTPATPALSSRAPAGPTDPATIDQLEARFFSSRAA